MVLMSWYYNDVTGEVFQETGVAAIAENVNIKIGSASGWLFGDKTYGPYPTQAQAQAQKNAHPPTGIASKIHSALSGATTAATGVGDFLGRLTQASTWIRVGEVLLGLALIIVGLAKLTTAVPAATKIASAIR